MSRPRVLLADDAQEMLESVMRLVGTDFDIGALAKTEKRRWSPLQGSIPIL
jgi:hypothetical protein